MTALQGLTQMIGQLLTGRYLVLKKLGVGGFSETYLARDKYLPHHPLCVVKCLKPSPSSTISPEISQRLFETEARILDQLGQHHDQIPTLFAYCHEQDQIYQVQEYIEGENLGGWIARKRHLTADAAIALLLGVLPVLDYTHSHKVIHRDIKPSHLIRRHQDGRVVLIDFGAAVILSDTDFSPKPKGEALLAIGTPGYMPKEQQEGAPQFNSDLYALGMSVIHLMTGVCPKQFQDDPISGELDWQSSLSEANNPKLIAILARMVQSNSRDRYQCAADVLTALEALPATQQHSSQRWYIPQQQRSVQQILKPLAAVMLVAGLAGGLYFYSKQGSTMLAQLGLLPSQSDVRLTLLRDLPMKSAVDRMLIAPNNQVLVTAGSDHILRLWSLSTGSMLKSLSGHTGTVTALDMSRDSSLLISGGQDRTVRLWNVATGKLLREFKGPEAVTALAISPDAQTLVSGSKNGTLHLWNLQTGILLKTLVLPHTEVTAVTYGATRDSLISASSDRQLQVWDLRTGQLRRTFVGHTSAIVGLQAVDAQTVMSFSQDRALVWNLQSEELVRVFSGNSSTPVAALLDQRRMMSVDDQGSIRVWARETGWQATTISSKWQNLDAALSPNQRYLACWSPDQRLRVWQVSGVQ